MSRSAKLILRALIAFVIIVILLTISECRASGSTIHNLWDALWYALITLTTVGYGDLYPVTPAGRLIARARRSSARIVIRFFSKSSLLELVDATLTPPFCTTLPQVLYAPIENLFAAIAVVTQTGIPHRFGVF